MKRKISIILIIIGIILIGYGIINFKDSNKINPNKNTISNNDKQPEETNKIKKEKILCDPLLDVKEIDVDGVDNIFYFITNSNDGYILSLTNTFENNQNCKKVSNKKVTNIIDLYFVDSNNNLYNYEDFSLEKHPQIYKNIYLNKNIIDDGKMNIQVIQEGNDAYLLYTLSILKNDGKIYQQTYKSYMKINYNANPPTQYFTYDKGSEKLYLSHNDEKIINLQFTFRSYRPYYKTDKAFYTYIDNPDDFCHDGTCYIWSTPYYEKATVEAKYEKNTFYNEHYDDILFITERLDSKNYSYISKDGYHIEFAKEQK